MDLEQLIEQLNEELGENTITTASNINRPEPKPQVKEIEMFNDFNTRNPLAGGGMLVQPSADGSRPGYGSDRKDVIEKAKKRAEAREKGLIYDTATKTFRKKEGVTYLTTSQKNKIKEAFPNVKLNFNLYPTTGVKKYLTGDQNKTNKTWAAINRFKKKGYTLEDLRTGGSGTLPPLEKGKVSATELLEMINKAGGTTYGPGYLTDTRSGNKGFLQNIIADTLNRELRTQVRTTKGYRKTKGPRTYYVFDKPTAAQLDFFVQYIDAPFLYDKTVKNVKILDKAIGKELAKSTKKDAVEYFTNDLTIDRVKQILKDNGVKNPTNYKAANAMTRYGQALQGKLFKNLDGITKNTKTGDFVFAAFNGIDRYHPWSQGAYTAILNDIDNKMGKQAGNLSEFKNAFKAKMKALYPDRKFDFNEVFSLSTSVNRGSYPYAYFVDLTSSAMNRGALSAYQGAASIAEGKIQTAITNFRRTGNKKFYDEAVRVANVFNNKTRKNFLSSEKVLEYQKNYGIKPNALKIEIGSQRQVRDRINIASNYFSDKNLQKWKKLGLDIDAHSGRAGYVKTFGGKGVPKNVITAGELFTEDTRLGKGKKVFDEKKLNTFLSDFFCDRAKKAEGGRLGFANGTCTIAEKKKNLINYSKRVVAGDVPPETAQRIAKEVAKVTTKAGSKGALATILGPAGIGLDVVYEVGSIGADVLSGTPLKRALENNWITGAFTKTTAEEAYNKDLFRKFPEAQPFGRAGEIINRMIKIENALDNMDAGVEGLDSMNNPQRYAALEAEYKNLEKELDVVGRKEVVSEGPAGQFSYETYKALEPGSNEQIAYNRAKQEFDSIEAAKAPLKQKSQFGIKEMFKDAPKRPYLGYGKEMLEMIPGVTAFTKKEMDDTLKNIGEEYGYGFTPYGLGLGTIKTGPQTGKYSETLGYQELADKIQKSIDEQRTGDIARAGGVAYLSSGGIASGPQRISMNPDSGGLKGILKRAMKIKE